METLLGALFDGGSGMKHCVCPDSLGLVAELQRAERC